MSQADDTKNYNVPRIDGSFAHRPYEDRHLGSLRAAQSFPISADITGHLVSNNILQERLAQRKSLSFSVFVSLQMARIF
jgi:hypothetical protein